MSRTLGLLREEGPAAVRLRVLDATVYRRLIIVRRRLDVPLPVQAPPTKVEFSLLGADETRAYGVLRPDTPEAEVRRRLDAGQWCLVGRVDGRLAHACWASPRQLESPYLGFSFELPHDVVYAHDVFTAEWARRRRISVAGVHHFEADLRERGFRILLGSTWPGNSAGMGMLRLEGRIPVGSLTSLRLGPARMVIRRRMPAGYVGTARRFAP